MKKKIIAIACLASLILTVFTACSAGSDPTESAGSSVETSSADKEVSEPEKEPDSSEKEAPVSSHEESSAKQEESKPTASAEEKEPSSQSEASKPAETALSTKKVEYSFGVASNEKPHSQSVNNQKAFDNMKNVDALALDTKSADKRMYLTFDCGYEYQNLTADILDTLKEKNVKAAFFCTLSYLEKNPELVQRMIDEGHIVGNHSATHPVFPDISHEEMTTEVVKVDQYLHYNFNYASDYFRYPSGTYSEDSLHHVTSIGKKSVFWSVAYGDWDTANQKGADYAFETVTARYHPGAVILLHAVSQDNADALGRMIDDAQAKGYTFKTLDDYPF